MGIDSNEAVRQAAMQYLSGLLARGSETVTWKELLQGFEFEGERIPLISQRGIHRLTRLGPVPLAIATTPPKPGKERPYDDELGTDGSIRYRYFQDNPQHPDNVGLRLAGTERVPLIYLYGVEPGHYVPFFPAFVVRDDPTALTVTVQVDPYVIGEADVAACVENAALREYVTRAAKRRLHQVLFRRQVVSAYRQRCAMCRFRHVLDAAHILPDNHPRGEPVIPNGMALCKLHHAVFDTNLVGVSPDYRISVRQDVLDEDDGPVLLHGVQALAGDSIVVPTRPEWRPDRERLAERYEMFRNAS